MRSAVYPGSFDPITNGHVFIAEKAAAIFDVLLVAVVDNPNKRHTFSLEDRTEMAMEALSHLKNVRVKPFRGLLVDFLRSERCRVIIRGLRAVSDFEYEFQLAQMNRYLAQDVETLFIVTDPQYSYLSSSMVKEIFSVGGNVSDLVPPGVYRRLRERIARPERR